MVEGGGGGDGEGREAALKIAGSKACNMKRVRLAGLFLGFERGMAWMWEVGEMRRRS